LTETTSVRVQITSENTPRTLPALATSRPPNTASTVYSGLVPISPNTTPSAPTGDMGMPRDIRTGST
jgi:hypothetical protein